MASSRGSTTGSSENHTTGSFESHTNGSSENPTAVRKTRKRGIAAVLQDASNTVASSPAKRIAKENASSVIQCSAVKQAARGMHTSSKTTSLNTVLKHGTKTFKIGLQCIQTYMTRNTTIDMQKALAIQVLCIATTSWRKGIIEASEMASEVTSYSSASIRRWASSFFSSVEAYPGPPENMDMEFVKQELSSDRGHGAGNVDHIIHDESFQFEARKFIRLNSCKKGEPNLTVDEFREWIKSSYSITICWDTARKWLQLLGFSPRNHKKGVFFDGHERDDVTTSRSTLHFLDTLLQLDQRTITPNGSVPVLQPGQKAIKRVVHDESTFYSNASQTMFWADEEMQVLRQKSLGQAIMVSDFIVEGDGYLRDEHDEARVFLETNSEGYFNNDKFLRQVDKALDIFDRKYPDITGLFIFDHAPCHKKVADDALNVDHMNVNPGGKQVTMRDTSWAGEVQKMVFTDGQPKGLKHVLEERGVDPSIMNAAEMRKTLRQFPDFASQKTLLEEKIAISWTSVYVLPKVSL